MRVESLKRELFRARVFYVLGWLSPIILIASIVINVCGGFNKSNTWIEFLLGIIFVVSVAYSFFFFAPSGTRAQLKNDISNLKWAIEKEIERLPEAW